MTTKLALIRRGFLYVNTTGKNTADGDRLLRRVNGGHEVSPAPRPGGAATFLLVRDDEAVMAVVDGEVVELGE